MYMKVTMKRAVAVTATRGLEDDDKGYTVQARAVSGNVPGASDTELSVEVDMAYVFERDGSVSAHHVGRFTKTINECTDEAVPVQGVEGESTKVNRDRWERGRLAYWALANRQPTKLTISKANIDGREVVEPVDPS